MKIEALLFKHTCYKQVCKSDAASFSWFSYQCETNCTKGRIPKQNCFPFWERCISTEHKTSTEHSLLGYYRSVCHNKYALTIKYPCSPVWKIQKKWQSLLYRMKHVPFSYCHCSPCDAHSKYGRFLYTPTFYNLGS